MGTVFWITSATTTDGGGAAAACVAVSPFLPPSQPIGEKASHATAIAIATMGHDRPFRNHRYTIILRSSWERSIARSSYGEAQRCATMLPIDGGRCHGVLRRSDLSAASAAMERSGFVYRHVKGIDMFLDGPDAKARDAVHVLFAGEKVRPEDPLPTPDVTESEDIQRYRTVQPFATGAVRTAEAFARQP
jgi:hypothetical protein